MSTAQVIGGLQEFKKAREEWNTLATAVGSPFLSHEWLRAWWAAFGGGEPTCVLISAPNGALTAAALCRRGTGSLTSPTNPESGDWDVLAIEPAARRRAWDAIASIGALRVRLERLSGTHVGSAASALRSAGYSVTGARGPLSPWRSLPSSREELLASISGNARSQFRRRRRDLEREGKLVLRRGEGTRDLDVVLRLEGSGWKRREGTAVLSDSRTYALYRGFAESAAARGWLRLYLLELDGRPIAADLGCAFAGGGFLLKTGFDETYSRFSPGLVLRGEVLQASIDEGLGHYDFLGGQEPYKLRWGATVRPRLTLWGYRGPATPLHLYRSRLRGRLRRIRKSFVDRR